MVLKRGLGETLRPQHCLAFYFSTFSTKPVMKVPVKFSDKSKPQEKPRAQRSGLTNLKMGGTIHLALNCQTTWPSGPMYSIPPGLKGNRSVPFQGL